MPVIYRKSEVKHQFAYNNLGYPVSIEDSNRNQYGSKYYLFQDLTCELILRDGDKNVKHFAIKSDAWFTYEGGKIPYSQLSESPEHLDFKIKIHRDGFFKWNGCVVYIQNTKIEPMIYYSSYRADLKAELLDGTPCVIEVIKSSKVSEPKRKYLIENEILTFEIFIDNDGNQISKQFDCYGNREFDRIREDIVRVESKLFIARERNDRARKILDKEKGRVNGEIQELEERLRSKIDELEKRIDGGQWRIKQSIRDVGIQIKFKESENGAIEEQIRLVENEARNLESYENTLDTNRELLKQKRLNETITAPKQTA